MSKGPTTRLGLAVALVLASFAVTAAGAGATEIAYNNFNTVPATVNGHPDEDTYSQDIEGFPFGGMVETVATNSRLVKGLSAQLDVFACEHGVYYLENCYTLRPNKAFKQAWKAEIREVGPGNTVGALIAESKTEVKLHYRPTTNTSCPATGEGKGFGVNCDVGGYLQTVAFKQFTQTKPLPSRVIVLFSSACGECEGKSVNVGLESAYKEFAGGEYISEPPADGGIPALGSDPLPTEAFYKGVAQAGWEDFQPVFKLELR